MHEESERDDSKFITLLLIALRRVLREGQTSIDQAVDSILRDILDERDIGRIIEQTRLQ